MVDAAVELPDALAMEVALARARRAKARRCTMPAKVSILIVPELSSRITLASKLL